MFNPSAVSETHKSGICRNTPSGVFNIRIRQRRIPAIILSCIHVFQRAGIKIKNTILDNLRQYKKPIPGASGLPVNWIKQKDHPLYRWMVFLFVISSAYFTRSLLASIMGCLSIYCTNSSILPASL